MSGDTQAATELLNYFMTGGGGLAGGAGGFYILQRLIGKTNGHAYQLSPEITELLQIARSNSQSLHDISDGVTRLNETLAEIKGAFSQIAARGG